jgi:hypothetical protein
VRRLAAAAAAVLLGPLAQAGGAAPCPGITGSGGWSSITMPAGAFTTAFALAPVRGRPDTLYAAQGRVVHRSADGGCTWQAAFSLDALPATSVAGKAVNYTVLSLSVGPAPAGAPAPVWLLAGDSLSTLTAPMPVLTAVSRDGGKTWVAHEPAPAQSVAPEAPGGYPQCTNVSRLLTAPQPGTAYLHCDLISLGTFLLLVGYCRTAFYVTRDWGATWETVFGRVADAARASEPGLGCTPAYVAPPQADRDLRGVVWTLQPDGVRRSAKDGRAPAMFAPLPVSSEYFTGMDVGPLRSGRPVVLLRSSARLQTTTGGKPKPLAPMPLKTSERGLAISGAVLDGTDRIFVAYLDAQGHSAGWTLDVVRGTWQRLGAPPPRADKTEAWQTYRTLDIAYQPGSRYVYVHSDTEGRVLRHALP